MSVGKCTYRYIRVKPMNPASARAVSYTHLDVYKRQYLKILRRVRELPGVKKVFIRSGIRFDYLHWYSLSPLLKSHSTNITGKKCSRF